MRSILTSFFIPVGLIGSTVLAGGDAALNRTAKPVGVARPAAFQAEADKAKNAAEVPPAPEKGAPRDEIGEQTRSHRVRLSSDGLLPGTISVIDSTTGSEVPATELNIVFMQNGEIVSTAKPGVAGVFQAQGLAPGHYSVIASGRSGFLAYGLEVVAAEVPAPRLGARPVKFQQEAATFAINALAVPLRDVPMVVKLVNSYIPASAKTAAPTLTLQERDFLTADEINAQAGGNRQAVASISAHAVELQADGRVLGRMRRIHPQSGRPLRFRRLNVFLVQGDALPVKAGVQEAGNFEFKNVQPGDYSVVAAGPEGFSAFAVRVVKSQANVAGTARKELFMNVSFNARMADGGWAGGTVIDMADFPEAARQLADANAAAQGDAAANAAAAPPGGGAGGGGAGGGGTGGGAGGGGGAGLLGAALGAAGLAAALSDGGDGGDDPPVSPDGGDGFPDLGLRTSP